MSTETIQAIEHNIKNAKGIIEFGNALERLRGNKDFKRVILEGYFEQEAIRLVHLKSDPNMQSPVLQQSIVKDVDAIGSLSQYFNVVMFKTAQALKSIGADEEARDEILAEELTND